VFSSLSEAPSEEAPPSAVPALSVVPFSSAAELSVVPLSAGSLSEAELLLEEELVLLAEQPANAAVIRDKIIAAVRNFFISSLPFNLTKFLLF
jgi:hypothetical protein